jgi:hypothetical protein
MAYNWLETIEQVTLHAVPDRSSQPEAKLEAGTSVQVKGLSWDETHGAWWYYVESGVAEGWALPDALAK